MKKFFFTLLSIVFLVFFAFMAIMPSQPKTGECGKFHPHVEEFGGPAETLKVLGYLATNMNIQVWTDGIRTIVTATYNMKNIFIAYGNGNPTMFGNQDIDYIRRNTSGMQQVTSPKGIQDARNTINNCLKASLETQMSASSASATSSSLSLSSLWVWGLAGIGTLIGLKFLQGSKRTNAIA